MDVLYRHNPCRWRGRGSRPTKAEKVALKQAIVACKAEAKGRKVNWLSRRKYVNQWWQR
ncbi:hypothetical protein [Bradyrhizobium sp. UFLA05-112]